uniref:Uncharacterized protein n=1 Tax=Nymphaea colorata TaxID=210225 RepID=A0A5K0XHU7_9MAGN
MMHVRKCSSARD